MRTEITVLKCLSVFVSISRWKRSVWPERRPSAPPTAAFTSGWASAKHRAERTDRARGQKIMTTTANTFRHLHQRPGTETQTDTQTRASRAAYMWLRCDFNTYCTWQRALRCLEGNSSALYRVEGGGGHTPL